MTIIMGDNDDYNNQRWYVLTPPPQKKVMKFELSNTFLESHKISKDFHHESLTY